VNISAPRRKRKLYSAILLHVDQRKKYALCVAPRWSEAELRQDTPKVIRNRQEVIKTRGESYSGKKRYIFRL